MASLSLPFQTSIWGSNHRKPSYLVFGIKWGSTLFPTRRFLLRAVGGSVSSGGDDRSAEDGVVKIETETVSLKDPFGQLRGTISSFPPVVLKMKGQMGSSFGIGLCIATAFLVFVVKAFMGKKSRESRPGSVADLVRRGQLRSDRRGISSPLKYDDPFNNPMVKVAKNNSTVEMCGKVYRLAPVTLTEEEQTTHQRRRSRAYQWKRPTVFLKEGDSIPPDVDPDTVRWIPANHPFATTASDIDEDLAQTNVHQKHGVPFRIKAEHEAMQRKLEALQNEQRLNNVTIDSSNAKDFERAFKSYPKSPEQRGEENFLNGQAGNSKPPSSERPPISSGSTSSSEEMQNPQV